MNALYIPSTMRPTPFVKNHPLSFLPNWHSLSKFVTAPKAYKVVGLLRQDMGFGLLAIAPNGDYVRVNGSYVEPIHPQHVEWLCAVLKLPRPVIRINVQGQSNWSPKPLFRAARSAPTAVAA